MKYAFVDLDETLIHTNDLFYCSKFKEAETATVILQPMNDKYYALYRQGAREFLSELRKNCDKVFMLTAATQDYAEGMNEKFNLGFCKSKIYSRYDFRRTKFEEPTEKTKAAHKLVPGAVFLYDNLHYNDNREKIRYLEGMGALTYVKVEPFYGNGSLTAKKIAEYILEIKQTKV